MPKKRCKYHQSVPQIYLDTRYYTSGPVVCEIHEGLASRKRENARGDQHIQVGQRVLYLTKD